MAKWRLAGEPSLDDLFDDEIMDRVMRTAGLDAEELRRRLADLANRLADEPQRDDSCGGGSSGGGSGFC
ncbi:MAG TPA: hypothetical protein VN802_12165 [Stellaceae bacterium]|nr:hypothetical protein [Stellaceae bacterium]